MRPNFESDLVDFPAVQLDNTNGTKYPKNGKLLYAFSGYNLIYKDKNQSGGTLTLGPASTRTAVGELSVACTHDSVNEEGLIAETVGYPS